MAYTPGVIPDEPSMWRDYINRELLQIAAEFRIVEEGQYFRIWKAEPEKPRDGMLAIALGAPGWNPGSGAGIYERKAGAWVKL